MYRAARSCMRRGAAVLILVTAVALGSAAPACAGALEVFGAWEGDRRHSGYGFAGLGASLPLGRHVAIPVGASASFLYYQYDSSGAHVLVRSPGASLMTGIRIGGGRGAISAMAGGEARWEHRNSGPVGSPTKRTTHGAVFQTYDYLSISRRWQASVLGVYVGASEYVLGRAAVRCQLTNLDWKGPTSFFLGVEGGRQGNDLSDSYQTGGFLEWNLVPRRLVLGLRSGYKESWSPGEVHRRGPYFGTSLYGRL